MRLFVIVLTVLVVIGACGRDLPEGVVQPQAMKALLLDMHLAGGIDLHGGQLTIREVHIQ